MNRTEFLKTVYKSAFWRDLKVDFVAEAKRARTIEDVALFASRWSSYLYFDSPVSTIKGRSLEMRKELEKNNIDEKLIKCFKIPSAIFEVLNSKSDDAVLQTLSEKATTDFNYIDFVESTIESLIKKIENEDFSLQSNNSKADREKAYAQLVVLALATGRRQIELLKMISISKKKDEALYENLAKKKDSDNTSVVAPILIDINLAKKYLKNIREVFQTEEMTNKEINSKYNASIANAMTRLIKEWDIKEFHFLRASYAEYCFQKFSQGADKHIYYASILGHETAVNETMHYLATVKKKSE